MHPSYLPHLDGLRFVLLLGVLLFHFEVSPFTGGFIGVDSFFVLSGFLISRNILLSLSTNTFSLRTFYLRRFWRLYPSSLVTTALAALFACLAFPEDLAAATAGSALSSLLLVSNVHFWREAGYFDEQAVLKPLLHMWSLSLEEQFYALWPVLLVFASTRGGMASNFAPRAVILTVTALSLAMGLTMYKSAPAFIFFMLPCRVYEFGVGAFCALTEHMWHRDRVATKARLAVEEAVSAAAIVALCGSFIVMPQLHSPLFALPIAIATAAVIATPNSTICKVVLGNKLIRWLGRLTYSAYLLHWVLFVFVRYVCNGVRGHMPGPIVLVVATFAGAWAMRRSVEEPFRKGKGKSVLMLLMLLLATVAFCIVGVLTDGWSFRLYGKDVGENGRAVVRNYRKLCVDPPYVKRRTFLNDYSDGCRVGDLSGKDGNIVVIGDSYARHLIPAFNKIGKKRELFFVFNFFSNCPLMAKQDEARKTREDECLKFENRRWKLIEGKEVPNALPMRRNATVVVAWFGQYKSLETRRRRLTMLESDLKAAGHRMMIAGETPGLRKSEKWRFACIDMDRTPLMRIIKGKWWGRRFSPCVSPWVVPKLRAAADWEDYKVVFNKYLPDVGFIDFFLWLCKDKGSENVKCHVLSDYSDSDTLSSIGYDRDGHHLTREGSEYLTSLIEGYLPL